MIKCTATVNGRWPRTAAMVDQFLVRPRYGLPDWDLANKAVRESHTRRGADYQWRGSRVGELVVSYSIVGNVLAN